MKVIMSIVLLGLSMVLLFFGGSYVYIMNSLVVTEEPVVSDIIIVPEGGVTVERARSARQLLDQGYSRSGQVVVSPLVANNMEYYEYYDFHEEEIINEVEATNTYENALNTLEIVDELGYDSAIVTSSDYHMKRVKLLYDRVNQEKDYNFDLTYVAALHEKEGELVTWKDAPRHIQSFAREEFWKYWWYILRLNERFPYQ